MINAIPRWCLLCGSLLLTSCGGGGTSPSLYVLSPTVHPRVGVVSDAGRPVVALNKVSLPEYLDTTDLLSRDGQNELKSSTTGRWGERLSAGVTRAIVEGLSSRLPGMVVDRTGTSAHPAISLQIDFDAFDVTADARCVLSAHWTILGEDRQPLATRRASIVTNVARASGGSNDAVIVAAMNDAVDQLADHIASDLARTSHGAAPIRPPR